MTEEEILAGQALTAVEHRHDYSALVDAVQANNIRLAQLAEMLTATPLHVCRFDENEAKLVHRIAEMSSGDGMKDLEALFRLGHSIRTWHIAGIWAAAALITTAIAGAIWAGITSVLNAKIGRGP
jgi:hypothetical protein